jgi:hypothetical protein
VKIKSQKDFWSGLMFVAMGLGFSWGATDYSFGSPELPGPGFFPFGLGLLMAVLGAVVLFKALVIETEDGDPIGPWAIRPLVVIVVVVALFGLALPVLGLVLALPALIAAAGLARKGFRWKPAALSAVVFSGGAWFVFVHVLRLALPLWPRFITS